ncbi:hypothetical protein AB0I28_32065 [Phytomonospora sp. NPDC050363]|uniref:hypothetical protein n=1 Tax=Phytomonospora sp. NPDC050363 TaxID=3155642 RepID=UPI0034119D1E
MHTRIEPVLDGILHAAGCGEQMVYDDRAEAYACRCRREKIPAVTAHQQTLTWLGRIGLAHRQPDLTRECLQRCEVETVIVQRGQVVEGVRAR